MLFTKVFCRALLGIALLAAPALAQDQDTLSEAERAQIEAVVRDYILNNPEIIPQAIQVLQQREEASKADRVTNTIKQRREDLTGDIRAPRLGPDDAAVTLVEFSDYQCPYCRRSYKDVARLLDEGQVQVVFKQLPILDRPGEEPVSRTGAKVALAAAQQGDGLFRKFHDAVMRSEGDLTEARLFDFAEEAGLDMERLRADMEADWIEPYLRDNLMLARSLEVTGTPAYVIGDQVVFGARGYEVLKDAIAGATEGKSRGQ